LIRPLNRIVKERDGVFYFACNHDHAKPVPTPTSSRSRARMIKHTVKPIDGSSANVLNINTWLLSRAPSPRQGQQESQPGRQNDAD
jgi:hypothetical protein